MGFGLIYATTPLIVAQSRYAWNPNLVPVFVVIFIWGLWSLADKQGLGWLIVAVSLATLWQIHYSTLVLFPAVLLFLWLYRRRLPFNRQLLLGVTVFILLFLPLLLFEFRHEWSNTHALINYLQHQDRQAVPTSFFSGVIYKLRYLLVDLIWPASWSTFSWLAWVFWLGIIYLCFKLNQRFIWSMLFVFITGLLVSGLYPGRYYDYFLISLYPFPFLISGWTLGCWLSRRPLFQLSVFIVILIIIFFNLIYPARPVQAKRTITDIHQVCQIIAADLQPTDSFNLVAVLGGDRFDYNAVDYRYFLETFYSRKSLDWETKDYQKASVLYVVARSGLVDPLNNNIMEINSFAPRKITKTWVQISGMIIYKLTK
jgi:hypothetical protein